MAHIKMNFLPCTGHQRYERDHHVLLATALCNLPDQHMGPALRRGREDQACRKTAFTETACAKVALGNIDSKYLNGVTSGACIRTGEIWRIGGTVASCHRMHQRVSPRSISRPS